MHLKEFLHNTFVLAMFVLLGGNLYSANIKYYNNDNGLGNDHVKGAAFDKFGYLWIGTESGLKRFDGAEFKHFNLNQIYPNLNLDNRIVSVFPMNDGSVMGIAINGHTFRAVGDTFIDYQYSTLIFGDKVKCALYQNFEVIQTELSKKRYYRDTYLDFDLYDKIQFYNLNCQPFRTLEFPSFDKNLNVDKLFNTDDDHLFLIDPDLKIRSFDGLKWIQPSEIEGLEEYDNLKPWEYIIVRNRFEKNTFLVIKNDLYLIECDQAFKNWKAKKIPVFLQDHDITAITYSNKTNSVAIGTVSNGLIIAFEAFKPDRSKIYRTNSERGLIFIDSNRLITSNFKLIDNGKISSVEGFKFDNHTSVFVKDRFGRIVTFLNGKHSELIRILPDKKLTQERFPINTYDHPKFITEDPQNRIWISFPVYGLVLLENPKYGPLRVLRHFDKITNAKSGLIQNNKLYLFTYNSVMCTIDLKDLSVRFEKPQNMPGKIRSAYAFGTDSFMLVTYGEGPFMLIKNKVLLLPEDRLEVLKYAHCINEINHKIFVISTNSGLVTFTREEIRNYIRRRIPINYKIIKNFTQFKNEFNGECTPCSQVKDGVIYYSHIEGIAAIDMASYQSDENNILNFRLDSAAFGLGRMFLLGEGPQVIQMPETSNILRLKTSVIYWGDRSNLCIKAFVQNQKFTFDTIFQHNKPVFENLPPGENIVLLELYNADKLIKSVSFLVIVRKKLFNTTVFWFLSIAGFLIVVMSGIYLYNRFLINRNKALKEKIEDATDDLEVLIQKISQDKESIEKSVEFKNKIISVITHDVLGPMSFSNVLLNNIAEQMKTEADRHQLEEIKSSFDRILQQAYEILTWSKAENSALSAEIRPFDLSQLIHELYERNKPRANAKKIKFINEVPDGAIMISDLNILTIVLTNLLENAFKYGEEEVKISFVDSPRQYEISVCNSGQKFNPEFIAAYNSGDLDQAVQHVSNKNSGGFGLRICQEILKVLVGKISIDLASENRNCVRITLPKIIPEIYQ